MPAEPLDTNIFVHIQSPERKPLWKLSKDFHQNNPCKLNSEGIHVRHYYDPELENCLSWWDECGFVYAKRRFMVRWYHPRGWYNGKVKSAASQQCENEEDLSDIKKRISAQDNGWIIRPSIEIEITDMHQWVFLTLPMEIQSEKDLVNLRERAIACLDGDKRAFSDANNYDYSNWIADQKILEKER